jgi:hypothetical protein
MKQFWRYSAPLVLYALGSTLLGMNQQSAIIPAHQIDKTRWGAKATAYGICTIGSGMLLVTELYDFATNTTPETSLSTRFAGIGVALLGLKCFGGSAYRALQQLLAGHSNREAHIQEILIRMKLSSAALQTPEGPSLSSMQSITTFPPTTPLATSQKKGSHESVSSFVVATTPNSFDKLLRESSRANPQ